MWEMKGLGCFISCLTGVNQEGNCLAHTMKTPGCWTLGWVLGSGLGAGLWSLLLGACRLALWEHDKGNGCAVRAWAQVSGWIGREGIRKVVYGRCHWKTCVR